MIDRCRRYRDVLERIAAWDPAAAHEGAIADIVSLAGAALVDDASGGAEIVDDQDTTVLDEMLPRIEKDRVRYVGNASTDEVAIAGGLLGTAIQQAASTYLNLKTTSTHMDALRWSIWRAVRVQVRDGHWHALRVFGNDLDDLDVCVEHRGGGHVDVSFDFFRTRLSRLGRIGGSR